MLVGGLDALMMQWYSWVIKLWTTSDWFKRGYERLTNSIQPRMNHDILNTASISITLIGWKSTRPMPRRLCCADDFDAGLAEAPTRAF